MLWLTVKWEYEYDKESTWFDEDSGEERYALLAGATYSLPHGDKAAVEIRSVTQEGSAVKAEVCVDHHTVTVVSGQPPVLARASSSYSVCGDVVYQSWCLQLAVEQE